ncbi:MAG: DUF943 family protein [Pantoea sp.]|uniref:DUF943 family protein n=1 Tax=Pantoea septica TaxID=472695 RepID=UPI001C0F76C2|nr:DUF943 family protein [Pantoea septica]MBU5378544.1 DUF943 family protein [Pantoea septica]MDU6442751.1 DUF943 family protein [Pantoea sp.]
MTVKNKKILILVFLAACVLLGYWLWLSLRPVAIVAVHEDGSHASVLVKAFPFTDRGKINWWLKNKDMLKKKYNIPKPSSSGYFAVVFWDFGDGYKEEGKYDRRCFTDMKPPINCIDKNSLLMVNNSKNTGTYFSLDSGTYRLNDSGKMVKNKSD